MNISFPRVMWSAAVISGICTAAFAVMDGSVFQTLAITAGTFFYHLAMRLAVGGIVPRLARNLSPDCRWFAPRPWEKRFHRALRIREWKRYVPTYDPDSFSLDKHTPEQIIRATCVSELVHEWIMVFSLLPIAASCVFGAFWVFLLTSLAAALLDSVFVLLQRFNRPRMMSLLRRKM